MRCPSRLIFTNLCYFVESSFRHQLSTPQILSQPKDAQLAQVVTTVEYRCKETAEIAIPSTTLVAAAEIGHITRTVQTDETTITVTQPQIGNLLHQEWLATSLVAHLHLLGPTVLTGRRPDLHLHIVVNPEEVLGMTMVVDRMTLTEVEMIRTDRKVETLAEEEEIHIVVVTEGAE